MSPCPRATCSWSICAGPSVRGVAVHPPASRPLAGGRLIINANYNQSRSELERIIALLWLCVCVCVSCVTERERQGG